MDRVAPPDPRITWDLPAPGELARVTALSDDVVRVLAPNPSPMTLDGTNTYVVGAPDAGEVVVVDPGPTDADHLERVEAAVAERDAQVRAVLVTHHHHDHAEAAQRAAATFAAPIVAARPSVAGPGGRVVVDGERVTLAGADLEVVATPGHSSDHLAFRLASGALLTGDHVLGRGTSVVAHPDGDLTAYLASLRRVLDLGPDALLPGHGPELTRDPTAVLTYYAEHRAFREQQLLAALEAGPATPAQLVAVVYAEVDPVLWPAAERSTRATLLALEGSGRVRLDDHDVVHRLDDA